MENKIHMSLDDIIKLNRSQNKKLNIENRVGGKRRRGKGVSKGLVSKAKQNRKQNPTGGKYLQCATAREVQTSPRKPEGGISKRFGFKRIQNAKSSRGAVSSAWKQAAYNETSNCGKLSLSNLDYGISDSDIRELFAECGQLKKAAVHYDRSGRSLGTADLIFERRCDAVKAHKQYHRVALDGRPMNIQFLNDAASLTRPVSAADASLRKQKPKVRGNRTSAAAGGKNRWRNNKKCALLVEQLDAELEAYHNDITSIL